MAKFKIGDRVKINRFEYPQLEDRIGIIRAINPIVHHSQTMVSYDVDFHTCQYLYIAEKWIELAEPENVFHVPSYAKEYWYNIDGNFSYLGLLQEWSFDVTQKAYKMVFINPKKPENFNCSNVSFDKENYKKYLFTQEEKVVYEKEKQDNAFKLDPHEFPFHRRISGVRTQNRDDEVNTILSKKQFLLHDDLLDELQYTMSSAMGIPSKILFGRDINKPKNRIPDRVVFDESKGKVTVLISKFNDGEAPYRAYTSKVHGDDEYSGYFGFFLSYYKYLNRHLDGATRKELIDMAFEHGEHKEYIIEGAVSQEVMRLVKIDEWDNILTAILEVSKQNKGYWDYAEWKEMLRVHELETKREKQREVQKEIKKHQKEIDRLKKEV